MGLNYLLERVTAYRVLLKHLCWLGGLGQGQSWESTRPWSFNGQQTATSLPHQGSFAGFALAGHKLKDSNTRCRHPTSEAEHQPRICLEENSQQEAILLLWLCKSRYSEKAANSQKVLNYYGASVIVLLTQLSIKKRRRSGTIFKNFKSLQGRDL